VAYITIINEARLTQIDGEWDLCFQWCRYNFDDDSHENGYRFIWRRPNGNLQAARGQARIPSIRDIQQLVNIAKREGWGDNIGE
jgi:hypothetical protein